MLSRKIHGWLILYVLLFLSFPTYGGVPPDKVESKEAPSAEQAVAPADKEEEISSEVKPIADPLEPWNRLVFFLNDRLYFALVKPVARGYSFIVPEWGRVRVRNVFDNLKTPVSLVNCLLQGKLKGAGNELVRLLLNSTVGMGGMFDVADYDLQIKSTGEDLGLTFAHYGIGEGFYIVWPFIGPSSLRDSAGMAGDSFLYPINYITPFRDRLAVRSYEFENNVSLRIGEYEDLTESSLDPYVAMKDAYSEYRRNKIKEGAGERAGAAKESGWPGR